MKTLTAISACALIAMAAPAFAQSNPGASTDGMQQNGSPNAMGGAHPKQPGSADTQSGNAPTMTEGRSSVTDPNNSAGTGAGGAMKKGTATNPATHGDVAPGGGPGESSGK